MRRPVLDQDSVTAAFVAIIEEARRFSAPRPDNWRVLYMAQEEDYSDIDGTTVAEIIEKWKGKG